MQKLQKAPDYVRFYCYALCTCMRVNGWYTVRVAGLKKKLIVHWVHEHKASATSPRRLCGVTTDRQPCKQERRGQAPRQTQPIRIHTNLVSSFPTSRASLSLHKRLRISIDQHTVFEAIATISQTRPKVVTTSQASRKQSSSRSLYPVYTVATMSVEIDPPELGFRRQ